TDSTGTHRIVDQSQSQASPVELAADLSGITTNAGNIGLRTTGSGNLVLAAAVDAGTHAVGLESVGAITQTGGAVTASGLEMSAAGPISLPGANKVATLAAQTTAAATNPGSATGNSI